MPFSHILITRPLQEAVELAELPALSPFEIIIVPAYEFHGSKLFPDQIHLLQQAVTERPALLIFTSPRSVQYGLDQIPPDVLQSSKIASIGPTTARLLEQAGVRVTLRPQQGYSSEDLLETLAAEGGSAGEPARQAFILTAPGGRTLLQEGLKAQGFESHMLMVYGRKSALLEASSIAAIEQAEALLAVWTSANTMNALSQRLPPNCWFRLCRAEWLVTSERLRRVARAFSPKHIHLTNGPANADIATAIQALSRLGKLMP